MPGVSIVHSIDGFDADRFDGALDELCHFDWYDSQVHHRDEHLSVGSTSYPSYPVTSVETADHTVIIEGMVYGSTDLDTDILELLPAIVRKDLDSLAEWVTTRDGEYVIYVVDRDSSEVRVLNDSLGRLPLYARTTGSHRLLTREISLALEGTDVPRYDRLGLSQYLLLGYPLGTRTLWEGVIRVPPGSILTLDDTGEIEIEDVHTWNFEREHDSSLSVESHARTLASIFTESCERRSRASDRTVLSLSGGLDSRAIAAGLRDGPGSIRTATFDYDNGPDAQIAVRVADALGIDWNVYHLDSPSVVEMDRLLSLKHGLNHVHMGFILPFFERLRDDFGPAMTYVTGDGGDKLLPDLTPPRHPSSMTDLVRFIVTKERQFSVDDVVDLTGIERSRLLGSIHDRVRSYPESDLSKKAVHFMVYERAGRWLFEGEDRNRCFFWSTTPYYDPAFVDYAMRIPDEMKVGGQVQRSFLTAMWPKATDFTDAKYRLGANTLAYQLLMHTLTVIKSSPSLWWFARQVYRDELFGRYDASSQHLLQHLSTSCVAVSQTLNPCGLERVINHPRRYGDMEVGKLLTLTAEIARSQCDSEVADAIGRYESVF